MRKRTVLSAAAAVLFVGLGSLAQPRKGKPQEAEPKPAAEAADKKPGAKPAAEAADKKASESAPPGAPPSGAPADDLGPPPPKPSGATTDRPEARTSPLTPAREEFPDGGATPAPVDYDRLIGQIASLRSRVAALTATLFASRIKVAVETDDAESARITSLTLTLDDGTVFQAPAQFAAEDGRVVYDHAVAPGHHVLGIDIERYDARRREYRTWQGAKFSVVVPENKRLEAEIIVAEDSDMAEDFPDDAEGEYDLRVRMKARVAD